MSSAEKTTGENELLSFQLVATNTYFRQPKKRRYTWKSPGDRYRNQLNYILTRTRYRNSVNNSLSYPGADICSDHNLVVITVDDIRLKKTQKRKKKRNSTCKSLNKIQIHSRITSRRNWNPCIRKRPE